MLKSIRLQDFQSHVDTSLPLGPGLNIISGPSGNGKSSILRAVSATAYNNIPGLTPVRLPNGKAYTITIETESGTVIRTKGKKSNSYKLGDTSFEDVGVSVPEAVEKVLNISPIELDANTQININFANQMDAPFLLTVPDTAKVKFLNTLAGTNAVDLAAKDAVNLAKDRDNRIKETEALLDIKNNTASVLRKNIDHLHGLNKYLAEQMDNLAALKAELDKIHILMDKFLKFKTAWNKLIKRKAEFEALDVNSAIDRVKHYVIISTMNIKKNALETAFHSLYARKKQVASIDIKAAQAQVQQALKVHNLSTRYSDLYEKYKNMCKKREKLCILNIGAGNETIKKFLTVSALHQKYTALKANYLNIHKQLQDIEKEKSAYKQQYMTLLQGMQICPVCNSPITGTTLNNILEKL